MTTPQPTPRPTPPHFRDHNEWLAPPDTEIERLQGTLSNHLRQMEIKLSKPERTDFVKKLLATQNQTCAFGKQVNGMYCWNEPKENYTDDVYVEKRYYGVISNPDAVKPNRQRKTCVYYVRDVTTRFKPLVTCNN